MHCPVLQMQPPDWGLVLFSGHQPAHLFLTTNHLLLIGGNFSWEPWPSCLALPAETVGSWKGEEVGVHRISSPVGGTKRVGVWRGEAWRLRLL